MSEAVFTTSPLADSFQRCSHSFKELYLALFAYGPISLSKFNDEYGRFGVWGGDSGADRTGRGSLDDVLRNEPKVTSIIAEVLENLNEDLNICIALVKASTGPHEAQSHDGQEWVSDEESSISSGSDASDCQTGSRVSSKTQRILHLLTIIIDHIQSLFQVSILLRRPTISDKYLRSTSKRTSAESESPFHSWDLAHIIEKKRFWINQQRWDLPGERDKAEDIQQQMGNYLCKRLAIANVKRREQLYFWQTHPAQPSSVKLPNEQIGPEPAVLPNPIPTEQPVKKVVPRSEISKPSHGTKQSFSTVAKSDLNDSATFSGRPRTEYVSSTRGGKYVLRVPPIPEILDKSPTLKCPYCSTNLDAKSMLQRELWKKHVFRDLRPYACTFEQCENPEKLYLTRHDWIYHESQMHRRQWICASCSHLKFSSRNDIKVHLLANHVGQFPESQLMTMVNICERPMGDEEDADCPICLATLSVSALRAHLATHLEELALFVLPCHIEDRSQDIGSDKAGGADGQRLASNASSSEDGLPPLNFDKMLPDTSHSQDPDIFSTLLQSTMEIEQKNMEDWLLTSDQTKPRDDLGLAPLLEASTYSKQVQLYTAEEQVMETNKKILGADHPDTLASMASLASAYSNKGRWNAAEELQVQVMETRKRILGVDHPDTMASMESLAKLLQSQEKYDEAEPICRQELQLKVKTLGKEHHDTLKSMNNLALVLRGQGKYDEAESIFRETLQLGQKVLGGEHPITLESMYSLAQLLTNQDNYDEAESIFRQMLQLREKVLGKKHPITLESMHSLGWLLQNQEKYDEAESIFRQILQLRQEVLGMEHPDTLVNMNNLARLLQNQGKYDEAESIFRQMLQLREKVLGKEHPDT